MQKFKQPKKSIPDCENIPFVFIQYSITTKEWISISYKDMENCWKDWEDYKNTKPCAILNFGQYIINNFE